MEKEENYQQFLVENMPYRIGIEQYTLRYAHRFNFIYPYFSLCTYYILKRWNKTKYNVSVLNKNILSFKRFSERPERCLNG